MSTSWSNLRSALFSSRKLLELATEIYYNQSNAPMLIRTNDPKLNALAADFPELCKLTEEDEICGSYFEVDKHRVSIHVTRPYSEARRKKQSVWAKENGVKGTNKLGNA